MSDIKCTVTDCTFWAKGNNCAAEAIEVNGNPVAQQCKPQADMEVGEIGKAQASTSTDTMCKTFKQKR